MKISKKALSVLFVLLLVLGLMAGCSGNQGDTSTDSSIPGGDSTTSTSTSGTSTEGNTDTSSSADATTSTSGQSSANTSGSTGSSKSSQKTSTTKGTTTTTQKVPIVSKDYSINSVPAKLKGTTLTMFLYEDYRQTFAKDTIAAFEQKTGITFKTNIASKNSYATDLTALVASGKSPDIAFLEDNNTYSYRSLQPLQNLGIDVNNKIWDQELVKNFTFGGKTFGINVANAVRTNYGVILYNKRALNKAEMEDPYTIWKKDPSKWTWSKVWAMCDEFLTANNNKTGYFGMTCSVQDLYARCFGASFWRYDVTTGKYQSYINQPNTVKRYEELITAISKKYCTPSSDDQGFLMGYSLFNFTYSSAVEASSTSFSKIRNGNLGVVPVPTDSTNIPIFTYCAYGVPVGAKNGEAVPYFLSYVMNSSNHDMSKYWMNDEAKTVINNLSSRGKLFFGNGYSYDIWQSLINNTPSQVKTILDSHSGAMEDNAFSATESMEQIIAQWS